MKIYNGEDRQERRKKRYIIPLIYALAEITLAWLLISIAMIDFNIYRWSIWGDLILSIAIIYSIYKMMKIYIRQKNIKYMSNK